MKFILNKIIYFIALFLQKSYRFQYEGLENLEELKEKNKNFILAIWHQNLLPGILAQVNDSFVVIVSKSGDAEPVAYTCKKLGHHVVRGSSRKGDVCKGGQAAKNDMIEFLKEGYPGAVTVDGPKGPAKKIKPGIINMAKESKCVIVPYTVKANSFIQFNSWDKFQLPKPFSRIIVHYDKGIEIESDLNDFEDKINEIEVKMNEVDQLIAHKALNL